MNYSTTPSPVVAVAGTIGLVASTVAFLGAAVWGTPVEFGLTLALLTLVVASLWRWSR